ncbi:sugar ABC transporter substrate-binding protein [Parageobacillus thermoglucosidasius]|uniref:Maltodextrin-binding protein n=1 Tax=Parageobacillus thermoglucosidasius TaxID=1426 RepID=A0AAN0YNW7_PARTM|nr:extracellular solute-binding protein [Parageobacillus thermoglucosidasius]ALF09763.1 ABC transporter substrate-binding protein [Parageobacillus thermoglucosidasius]ANZ29844.1 ABC transporter substrate-binding protein [Parageobacillus thermoglucosidasius]APM80582.1 ABC transporter substrate-binding protein [Parageobacillus thermoglucosidasius]KJX70414.1 ABC transporter substrate-binding protein [Parageobacillus thermoglucosidasius]MBY6269094.1 ABC transporter substrate-binding protein [Parag
MRKVVSLFMATILMIGVLAACGPKRDAEQVKDNNKGNTTENVEKPEKLVVWVNDEEKQKQALNDIFKKYTEKTGIKVETVAVSMLDQAKKIALDGPAGKGPDIFYQPHDRIGDIVLQGLADPVELGDSESEYSKTAVDAVTYDRQIYGVPFVVETYGLFYNKNLVPEAPKTIEELTKIAKEKTNPAKDQYGFLMEAANFYFVYPFFAGYGGYVFRSEDGKMDVSDIGLANDGAVKGAELVQSWFKNGYIPKEINQDVMNGLFTKGNVATVISGPWNIATYRDALGDKLATAPLPVLENGEHPKSFVGVKAWMLSAYSKNKEWATDLMKFITNEENSLHYYEVAGEMPANEKALTNEKITNDPLISGFAEQIQYGEPMPNVPQMSQVWDPMGNALQFIAKGDNPKEVLQEAVKTIQDKIAASGGGK